MTRSLRSFLSWIWEQNIHPCKQSIKDIHIVRHFSTQIYCDLVKQVDRLRKQLSNLETEIKSLEILLAKADPDGYFKEGTHAARVAKERGIRLYNQDKHLKSALEKKKRQDAVRLCLRPHFPLNNVALPFLEVLQWAFYTQLKCKV